MKIILTLDDNNGMLFNKRRQNQDIEVRKRITEITAGKKLWLNPYSGRLFQDMETDLCIAEEFLDKAGEGEYCFVEDTGISDVAERIEELIIFRWNRRYPGDFYLDLIPQENGFICVNTEEFQGHSHDRITMEVWRKEA